MSSAEEQESLKDTENNPQLVCEYVNLNSWFRGPGRGRGGAEGFQRELGRWVGWGVPLALH